MHERTPHTEFSRAFGVLWAPSQLPAPVRRRVNFASHASITCDGSDNNKDWLRITITKKGAPNTLTWTRVNYAA